MASKTRKPVRYKDQPERIVVDPLGRKSPLDGLVLEDPVASDSGRTVAAVCDRREPEPPDRRSQTAATIPLAPAFRDDAHGIWLYHGNCLPILDAIYAKYGDEGRFDMIFADPPYFLSNGGITCHAGKMVKVDKGEWDRSRGPELNHEFNTEWLRRCQRVLKPNGTIWVTGTHHVIFSVGYAMQQLGMKILNDIAWEKPNPPPNLLCRYFTHSTETVLWAAKSEKSRHIFNYKAMKIEAAKDAARRRGVAYTPTEPPKQMKTVWTMPASGKAEKMFGKHPTQKPVALVERCLLAASNPGDFVLDPFMGAGTTAVACVRSYRLFVGIELDCRHVELAGKRADRQIIEIWLREFRVRVEISVVGRARPPGAPLSEPDGQPGGLSLPRKKDPNDLDPGHGSMDRISEMANGPEADPQGRRRDDLYASIQAERIFHETKFVFLSCAQVRQGSVVHTTVDADIQSAWSHTPNSIKLATTHIVRCETEILRVKSS